MTSFQKKMESIFEIKINEDKICTTFQAIELKLHSLQQKISRYEEEKKQRGIFDCNEEQGKNIINQLVLRAIQPLHRFSAEHDHALRNIQYNHNNLSFNIGEDYKILQRKLQESQLQISRKLAEGEVQTKSAINNNRIKIQENYSLFKHFMEETEDRASEQEEEVNKIWETLKKQRKESDLFDPVKKPTKKVVGFRHSEIKQSLLPVSQEMSVSKQKSSFKKQSLREDSTFQVLHKDKATQFASLTSKVDFLQKKIKEMQSVPSQEKVLSSKKRISNNASHLLIRNAEPSSSENLQEKKPFKIQKQSRFRNSIQVPDQNQQESFERRSERQTYSLKIKNLEEEIRKINVKLTDHKYKYSLLQENYEIVLSKMAKIGYLQSSIQLKIDEVQKLRVDLSTINEINMRFRKIQAGFEDHEKRYVTNEEFTKEIGKLRQMMKEVQSYSSKLARNDEIKSAFEFIETKIKEIVIVLTDKFQNDKEGAINKTKQIKCLTCDKEVQGNGDCKTSLSNNFLRNLKTRNTRTTVKRLMTQGG